MKKNIFIVVLMLMVSIGSVFSVSLAQSGQQNGNGGVTVITNDQGNNPGLYQQQNLTSNISYPIQDRNRTMDMIQLHNQTYLQNLTLLQDRIQERKQDNLRLLSNISNPQQRVMVQNQNQVRLAVQTLLGLQNLTPGIGQNISQIAREYNNSYQITTMAQEQIQQRNGFTRFFFGGDQQAAQQLVQQMNKNQNSIENLNRLQLSCVNCTEEVKAMIQEQMQVMQQEQQRLNQTAQAELQSKGLFGWFFRS